MLKRALDVLAAAAGLVVLAPFFLLIGAGHQARLAGPGVLPPGAGRAARPAVPHLQVPHDDGRPADRRHRGHGRGRRAHHPRRRLPASHQARRAGTAARRAARHDEPRRPRPRCRATWRTTRPSGARGSSACAPASPISPRCATATRTKTARPGQRPEREYIDVVLPTKLRYALHYVDNPTIAKRPARARPDAAHRVHPVPAQALESISP